MEEKLNNLLSLVPLFLLIALPVGLYVFFPDTAKQLITSVSSGILHHGPTTQPTSIPSTSSTAPSSPKLPSTGSSTPEEVPPAPPAATIFGLPIPPFFQPPPPPTIFNRPHIGPIQFTKKTVNGCPLYETVVNLQDADTYLDIGLPGGAKHANDAGLSYGDEQFSESIKRNRGAVVVNGTFFSKDDQKRVMGNVVAGGEFYKYSRWENYGTTFGLRLNNKPQMITANIEGQPKWEDYWFSITCGPRLLTHGVIDLEPEAEKFSDPHVLGIGPRTAMGFSQTGDKLYLITFINGLSLKEEAKLMKLLGCYEAMNMDGGASRALAYNGEVVMKPSRPLTNVLVVYDSNHKAPERLRQSWFRFQDGMRPQAPLF